MDKMIGLQSHLNVWAAPWVQHDIIQRLLQSQFFRNELISKPTIKKKLTVRSIKLAWFHHLLSWTSIGPSRCSIDKMIVRKAIWQSEQFLEYHVNQLRSLSRKNFGKWINFQIRDCKTFHCPLFKISLHYQTVIDQRLTVFHRLFSCTSVGPLKCLINKMIGSEVHLTGWEIPWVALVTAKNSFADNFFEMNKHINESF